MRKLHPFVAPYTKCLKWLSPPTRAHLANLQPTAIDSSLIDQKHPHFDRALELSAARLLHLCRPVARAYAEQFQRKYGRHYPGLSLDNTKAMQSKNLSLLLSIYALCSEHDIQLRHWFRAQFDILSKMKQVYLNACSGPNALKRYQDWIERQPTRFVNRLDRAAALDKSFYTQIEASVLDSHLVALQHWNRIKDFEPPTVGAGILVLYPQVSAWYLVSHAGVRDILEAGMWYDPVVASKLKQYKKIARIRSSCDMALDAAIENHGSLEV